MSGHSKKRRRKTGKEGPAFRRPIVFNHPPLDWFSSHPYWMRKTGRLWAALLIVPPLVVYVLILWFYLRGADLGALITRTITWFFGSGGRAGAGIAAFAVGVAVGFRLLSAMADAKAAKGIRGKSGGYSWAGLLMILAGCVVAPILLTFGPGIPVEAKVFGSFLAYLPIFLLTWLFLRALGRRRFPWGTLGAFVSACLLLVLLPALSRTASEWMPGFLAELFPRLLEPEGWTAVAAAMVGPTFLLLVHRLGAWLISRTAPAAEEKRTPEPDKEEQTTEDPVAILVERLNSISMVTSVVEREVSPEEDQVSPVASEHDFDFLFGGVSPTRDQLSAVKKWFKLAAEPPDFTGFRDLVAEGPPGSGRTTLLDAAGLGSFLVFGQPVLYLVADAGRIDLAIKRLERKLQSMGLDRCVMVARASAVVDFIDGRSGAATLPAFCVATMAEWEELVHGHRGEGAEVLGRLRTALLHYTAMMLDDWDELPTVCQAHAPLFIDKRRLFFAAHDIPCQSLFVFPGLGEGRARVAEDAVMERLIGHYGQRNTRMHHKRIRYRQLDPARLILVSCPSLKDVLDQIAISVAGLGEDLFLFRRNIDALEAEEQTEELNQKVGAEEGRIKVCYCLDQMAEVGEEAGIALTELSHRNENSAVLAIRMNGQPVVIGVQETINERIREPFGTVPFLVDRSAAGLVEAHLRNWLRYLPPRRFVHEARLGQLGELDKAEHNPHEAAPNGLAVLFADRPGDIEEAGDERNRHRFADSPAMISVNQAVSYAEPVDPWAIPDRLSHSLVSGGRDDGVERLIVTDPTGLSIDGKGVIEWFSVENARLGKQQIAHLQDLLFRRERSGESGCRHAPKNTNPRNKEYLRIEAGRFRGDGTDFIHPRYSFFWDTNKEEETEEAGSGQADRELRVGNGSSKIGFLWLERGRLSVGGAGGNLVQLANGFNDERPCGPLEFLYPARLSCLLLRPDRSLASKPELLDEVGPMLWQRKWDVNDEGFLPGLTFALQSWLDEELPGASFFGKVMAFQLGGKLAKLAPAVAFFIEPMTTGSTLSRTVQRLLDTEDDASGFYDELDIRLESGWDKSPSNRPAAFWLPGDLRKPVSLFERRLVWGQLDERDGERGGRGEPVELEIVCPHCNEKIRTSYQWGSAISRIKHCGHTITILVSAPERKICVPNDLIGAWCPAELEAKASGGDDMEKIRIAWQAVAERTRYGMDRDSAEAVGECWLPPETMWSRAIGDCEDHSILLVAILRKLGLDAWVVCGSADGGGHAWVECNVDGRERLIEATRKTGIPEIPPLVKDSEEEYAATYRPEWKCNGDEYWDWDGSAWQPLKISSPLRISGMDGKPAKPSPDPKETTST